MQFFTTIALILAAASSVYAAALPTPSGAPKCSYNCPGSDKKDWKLVGSHSLTSYTMRCDYFPFDFDMTPATCTYDTTTGNLLADLDSFFCYSQAHLVSCVAPSGKRDVNGVYEIRQRRIAERAAARAQNAGTPTVMAERAALGNRKLLNKRTL